jgi:hypothetical protein
MMTSGSLLKRGKAFRLLLNNSTQETNMILNNSAKKTNMILNNSAKKTNMILNNSTQETNTILNNSAKKTNMILNNSTQENNMILNNSVQETNVFFHWISFSIYFKTHRGWAILSLLVNFYVDPSLTAHALFIPLTECISMSYVYNLTMKSTNHRSQHYLNGGCNWTICDYCTVRAETLTRLYKTGCLCRHLCYSSALQ